MEKEMVEIIEEYNDKGICIKRTANGIDLPADTTPSIVFWGDNIFPAYRRTLMSQKEYKEFNKNLIMEELTLRDILENLTNKTVFKNQNKLTNEELPISEIGEMLAIVIPFLKAEELYKKGIISKKQWDKKDTHALSTSEIVDRAYEFYKKDMSDPENIKNNMLAKSWKWCIIEKNANTN